MDCTTEEVYFEFWHRKFPIFLHCNGPFLLEKANVFQLSILLPLMKILDIYMAMKHELSPDEFCILLFTREETKGKCKLDVDPFKSYVDDPEEFKVNNFH